MDNRRDFIKKAGLLAGTFGLFQSLPQSIQAALRIDPADGSTYLDAEHIVMVMQENRSFDHSFGTLRGVRGFNDPRALRLQSGRPVWLQSYKNGDTYAPFRLDIKNSNAAWTRDLPHSWENQIGAWNNGNFDNWLESKRSGNKIYRDIPLTLGYYTREDIPFYYAFADAFTICDQHFCSSITGTTTNRHYFWTGKCIPEKGAKPLVRNSDVYFSREASWRTFPELLEKNNISWKIYQNEISLQNELSGDAESWLGNFTDNNLEWYSQYHVRYKKSHVDFYNKRVQELPNEIQQLKRDLGTKNDQKLKHKIQQKEQQLESYQNELKTYNTTNFEKLDSFSKSLHLRAFQTNEGDPYYHQTEEVEVDNMIITVPKGDVLHQFREDVKNGQLPTVSWLCAPQNFSDHPSAPMYGAWYVSEILNILTKDPEIWKKTIFILNYDENDGYFDHIPPFVAPKPGDIGTGKTSDDLDYSSEYVTREQELEYGIGEKNATEGPVGLGYRVPLIIASPWSRGGWVNSEVCDITSTIQFMEHFLNKKHNLNILEDNISSWRRAITGNLSSAFRPFQRGKEKLPPFINRNEQVAAINKARDKPAPNKFTLLDAAAIAAISQGQKTTALPRQEKGTKPSNALCYELYVDEETTANQLTLHFIASDQLFADKALGGAFNVFAYGYNHEKSNWSFATSAGKEIDYQWSLDDFSGNDYALAIHGPNGYYRYFSGEKYKQPIAIRQRYDFLKEEIVFEVTNKQNSGLSLEIYDSYTKKRKQIIFKPSDTKIIKIGTKANKRWYDLALTIPQTSFIRRYSGRVENGNDSITDPLMGGIV
ncbi:phosphocholine-specific phospholipase C [Sphingobacterium gobiense]|uniref:phospholipase C n=1 Tax=Sphingobacterium gobiense TaxID=1382456 RepID=A0A2S9JU78_9SPHI|nr:phospholipase C, phosphocholine-specific [Sphingobacterium gobiense]PRD56826.1 phospholipase C, phosphocholine-specific [Sphingobacterium gobiense]